MKIKTAHQIRSNGSTENRYWRDEVYKEALKFIKKKRKIERQNRKKGRSNGR